MMQLPDYDGDLRLFLSELSYWLRGQGAPLREILKVEKVAADVEDYEAQIDELQGEASALECDLNEAQAKLQAKAKRKGKADA